MTACQRIVFALQEIEDGPTEPRAWIEVGALATKARKLGHLLLRREACSHLFLGDGPCAKCGEPGGCAVASGAAEYAQAEGKTAGGTFIARQ